MSSGSAGLRLDWFLRTAIVFKPGVLFVKSERYLSRGAVPLLRYDDLSGSALVFLVSSVNESNNVRILLDRSAFAEIAELGFFLLAILHFSIELGESQDWHR